VTYLFNEAPSGRRHVLRMLEDDTALSVPEKERVSNLGISYPLYRSTMPLMGLIDCGLSLFDCFLFSA